MNNINTIPEFLTKNYNIQCLKLITKALGLIHEKGINQRLISTLYDEHYYKGFYEFYINKNIKEARQDFYLVTRLLEISITLFDKDITTLALNFPAVVLHNNIELLERFSKLKNSNYYEIKLLNYNTELLTQSVLKDDYKEVEFLLSQFQKSKKINIFLTLDFFKGLINSDEELMIKSIYGMLEEKEHKKRTECFMLSSIVDEPTLMFLKLAYIKGFKLNINHSLIPNELLDMTANDEYWEYDFMKELGE